MKKQNYDERQLLARSKAFEYGFAAYLFESVIWCVLCELLKIDAEPLGELCLLLTPPFVVFAIVCIVRDAYDPISTRPGMIVFALMPLAALLTILRYLRDEEVLLDGRCLTAAGGLVFLEAGWLVLAVVYWICYARSGRETDGE